MINLKDFEKKLVIRTLKIEDFDALIALQRICFPSMEEWSREQIESQLSIFPEGQIVIEYRNTIVASSSCLIIDYNEFSEDATWSELTDSGYIRNHDPKGNTLYGMEIMVDPKFRNMKLARRLYEERKNIARKYNLVRIIIGGRIPGYERHKDRLSARAYVDKVMQKALFDPVLTVQLANGFVLKRLIPHYLDDDRQSLGFATLLEWANPEYLPDPHSMRLSQFVRICVVQYKMRAIASVEEFAKHCEYFIDAASEYKCDFILFPEALTTQLVTIAHESRPALAVRQISDFTPRYLEIFATFAVRYSINIIGGSHVSQEKGALYNVAYLFRRDGTIERQYKIHPTAEEQKWWGLVGGDKVEVFDTDRGKISIQIGCDIEFPEIARLAAKKGAQLIFVPFLTEERYANLRIRYCAQARAVENYVYVVTAGSVGNLPRVKNFDIHYATSGIYTPCDIPFARDGIAALCHPNSETVIIEDLNLLLLKSKNTSSKKMHSSMQLTTRTRL